jgi:tRNA(Ile)-lysidine synthase
VLAAVSGGADSTALLLGLHRLAPELGIRLVAAHLHHGLRGEAADGDLAFVRALCRRLQVPLVAARWDTRARMRRRGWSGQDGLRRLRREFLIQAARRVGATRIATAHTADDQLETLLLRLGRGAGLAGLGAMSARRGAWIRPLLDASRAAIEADLRAVGQPWREDASNLDPRYARNRVRLEAVPALLRALLGRETLEARGALARRVGRALREVRSARRWIEAQARVALAAAAQSHGAETRLDCAGIARLAPPVRRAALRLAWASARSAQGLTAVHLDRLEGAIRKTGPSWVDLPGGRIARREGGTLCILPRSKGIQPAGRSAGVTRPLRVPGRIRWKGTELRASWVTGSRARRQVGESGGEWFAADHLQGGLELRPGRTDEWFVPFGHQRPRRLEGFLKQQGVPRSRRAGALVLADQRGILWVVGVRRSARAPVTPTTRKALEIRSYPS